MADINSMRASRPTRKAIPPKLRFAVFKRDGFRCTYCGEGARATVLECDHVIPVSRGGDNGPDNLVTACKTCNMGKGAIEIDDDWVPLALVSTANKAAHRERIALGCKHSLIVYCQCGARHPIHDRHAHRFGCQPTGSVSLTVDWCSECVPGSEMTEWRWQMEDGHSLQWFRGEQEAEAAGAVSIALRRMRNAVRS